jgi:S-adenosylmethionine:tRNA ribosyltransferase-isomerase
MPAPKQINISDYDYDLPTELIAKYPADKRDDSKLLVIRRDGVEVHRYSELPELVTGEEHFFYNNTRVIHARLLFTKDTGGEIEIFLLSPNGGEYAFASAMSARTPVKWKCLVGGARKWKAISIQKNFKIGNEELEIVAAKGEVANGIFDIEFSWSNYALSFSEVLEHAGEIPLPPYFNRTVEQSDEVRYQTVYAKSEGSVAAPTAGLHFTPGLLKQLEDKGCTENYITLHVGAGTFKPVSSEQVGDHVMHSEYFEIGSATISTILEFGHRKIIPVGTTSLRALESLYWLGEKCRRGDLNDQWEVHQWEGYTEGETGSLEQNLGAILKWMADNDKQYLCAKTSMLIAPGYSFRVANGLITNFHMPQSTLLLLVAAMVGPRWKEIYQYAMEHDFRFLSYGDGMIVIP